MFRYQILIYFEPTQKPGIGIKNLIEQVRKKLDNSVGFRRHKTTSEK
jgi:hypothetical protein